MRRLLRCLHAECHRVPRLGPRAAAVLAHLLAARRAHAGLLRGAAAAVQLLEAHLASAMEREYSGRGTQPLIQFCPDCQHFPVSQSTLPTKDVNKILQ